MRSELCLTQKDFSKMLAVSDGLIACIETGKREANERTIKLICDSFHVNREWLKTGKGDMFSQDLESKYTTLIALFSNLKPKYQDYIIDAIDRFLKIQDE